MRVKIGAQWFEAEPGQPIAVELNPSDRDNIANMAPDAKRYAVFNEPVPDLGAMRQWIED
jgi:hypothetical protein